MKLGIRKEEIAKSPQLVHDGTRLELVTPNSKALCQSAHSNPHNCPPFSPPETARVPQPYSHPPVPMVN